MKPAERLLNWAAGLSVLSWAVLPWVAPADPVRVSTVRVCISLLHLCVGLLFLLRAPLRSEPPLPVLLLAGTSLLTSGAAFALSPDPALWPVAAQVLFAAGTALAIPSLCCLGRSFAVLPALRQVVARGPYRLLRHPAYAGECLLLLSCLLAGPGWAPLGALTAAILSVVLRVRLEEALLGSDPAYADYARGVRWRLLPGVW
ncbi:MAG: methyltransferase family protein [Planctomycetota bacterium]